MRLGVVSGLAGRAAFSHGLRQRAKIPAAPGAGKEINRSEEHTSELQSQSNLVCRLLLAKKIESLPPSGSKYGCLPSSTSPASRRKTATATKSYRAIAAASPKINPAARPTPLTRNRTTSV